jgi:hypothetical protein
MSDHDSSLNKQLLFCNHKDGTADTIELKVW